MAREAGRHGLKAVHAAIGTALVLLLGGRWLAGRTTHLLWAESLGVGEAHAGIAELRLILVLIAFTAAAVWCLGNLYAVYRSIGSLHVPRRLGNLEFVEALPPNSLLVIVVILGLALALLLSNGATDWWRLRALDDMTTRLGLNDPILGRDLSFYLFHLPWRRAVHQFVTVGVGVMLAVSIVLYAAVGAVRWAGRALHVTDLARVHLAVLLGGFALALYWGYRLEPVEYVGGLHNVPLDAVLLEVRLPAARLLSSIALLVALTSFSWIWIRHLALAVVPWIVLATVSFSAHYVIPAVSGGGQTAESRTLASVEESRDRFVAIAYGVSVRERPIHVDESVPLGAAARNADRLAAAPIWDPFAITALLNQATTLDSTWRFEHAALGSYPGATGPVPVYLSVAVPDPEVAGGLRDADWDGKHRGPYARVRPPIAIHAHRAQRLGFPHFVPNLGAPDSGVASVTPAAVSDTAYHFGPALTEYAVTDDRSVSGVRAGGLVRRLALAWVLQSPRIITRSGFGQDARIVWHRAVSERLERYAPFARFGEAYPIVTNGRLYWMASGYLGIRVFPLTPAVSWRGRQVRALSAGLIGVVDAGSGETRVYLVPGAGPVSAAWADLAPTIVRPWDDLSPDLRQHVRYPEELFGVQRAVMAGGAPNAPRGLDSFWWLGATPHDSTPRLRLMAGITEGDPPQLTGIVAGAVIDGAPTLTVASYAGQASMPSPAEVVAQIAAVRPDDGSEPGQMRWIPLSEGPLAVQAFYRTSSSAGETPRLVEVAAVLGGVAARGGTLVEAVRRLGSLSTPPRRDARSWVEASRWFQRLDAARRSGDWEAFGEAYDALRTLLAPQHDTLP